MNICFTGPAKIAGMHIERKYLAALAAEKGHRVQSRVDASTDVLVADPEFLTKQKTKARAAQEHHTQCVTPDHFLKMMEFA